MSFAIRLAGIADVRAMHRLRNSVRENRLSDPQRISEASYLPFVAAGSSWIAETDTCILGFGIIDANKANVWALFVDAGAEGRGVGQALLSQIIKWSRAKGLGQLSLSTGIGKRAVQFYERAGWKKAGTTVDGEVLYVMKL